VYDFFAKELLPECIKSRFGKYLVTEVEMFTQAIALCPIVKSRQVQELFVIKDLKTRFNEFKSSFLADNNFSYQGLLASKKKEEAITAAKDKDRIISSIDFQEKNKAAEKLHEALLKKIVKQ